ncbi:MAG: UDP-N-acetylmuramate dehydrogenase [Campylobacterales bacterium]|nr:UDP-N-acetylmuramate dehydrogenase [Campylobacterales bacterium]
MKKTIDFKKYSSIHIGPKVCVEVIQEKKSLNGYMVIGKANNLLVSPKPKKLAILGEEFDYILIKNGKLIVGAATTSGKLLSFCRKNNIANFEFLAKLPGTIGGLTKMNAGLKTWEIFNYIHSITTDKGVFLKDQIKYSYRYTSIDGIIYEVVFDLEYGFDKSMQDMFIKMRDNQPQLPSAGSCFKNPKEHSAGYLIEKVGLKGHTIGGMAFSSVHANFLVNTGNGTFDEAMKLIQYAQKKVKELFHIELELEIQVV